MTTGGTLRGNVMTGVDRMHGEIMPRGQFASLGKKRKAIRSEMA